MTATDRTHEPDETFRAVLDRIEGAVEAFPHDAALNRLEATGAMPPGASHKWPERWAKVWGSYDDDLAARFELLGNPFRAEGEPGVDG